MLAKVATFALFVLVTVISGEVAAAVTIKGKVGYVGTLAEYRESSGVYHAQFRFRFDESVCDTDQVKKKRWIHVKSGRMDGKFVHNMANFRNAYSTVMSGLLAGVNIQVTNVPNCDAGPAQTVDLWRSFIGIYR